MNSFYRSRFLSTVLFSFFCVFPTGQLLSVSDAKKDCINKFSQGEYISVDPSVSALKEIVSKVSCFDQNDSSPINLLKRYLENGNLIALKDEVLNALEYSHWLICSDSSELSKSKVNHLVIAVEGLMQSIERGDLSVHAMDLEDNCGLRKNNDLQDTALAEIMIHSDDNASEVRSSLSLPEVVGFETVFNNPSSLYVAADGSAALVSATTDRDNATKVVLASDTAVTFGSGTTALRGWTINKNATTAELSFDYENSDIVGQAAVPQYTVMQLDGLNNQLQLPATGTEIVFAGDTNLYRDSANVLKTDDNFIIGTLTADRVLVTNAGTNQLESSPVTNTELGYLSGVTSSVQTQINGKVAKAGDTMTGALQLPAGTTALPSLTFTGSTTTGLSAAVADELSLSTAALERMKISSSGVVSINAFGTVGVVHNDASGNLSTSLIVNADVDPAAAIVDTKLATISTAGKVANSATTATSADSPNTIVLRDGSGNFATNMITLNGTVTNGTDAATKDYVDTAVASGITAKTPALVASESDILLTGLQTIDGVLLVANDRVLLVGQTDPIENGLWLAQAGAWTRPADFDTGDLAGQAYVLVSSGANYQGASWLCSTPTAIIGTDPIFFEQFSLPDSTTGANVGAGTGLVFRDKTGVTLNFRSIIAGSHLSAVTNANDITLTTDATNLNTASTLVSRDGTGSFAAQTISLVDGVVSGNISMSDSSSASVGNIVKNGTSFIHNFGTNNTFVGRNAGNFTMSGVGNNTAMGVNALSANTTGFGNVALGSNSLVASTIGSNNIAIGDQALVGTTTGTDNISIGVSSGLLNTTGSNNIYINSAPASNESNTIRIGTSQTRSFMQGVFGVTAAGGTAVFVKSDGQLGTTTSSRKFKHDIVDLGDVSEKIYDLDPVSFVYNNDATDSIQYGLIAEEVDEVFPALVVRDSANMAYTVKYEVLPILLLNEMKKQKNDMLAQRKDINSLMNIVGKLQNDLTVFMKRGK